ncbi:MAG TPA: hypothetical protein VFI13_07735 [Gemmatimonadales bacterium]|nr:hypothetical protein [Gemmatimonadales bacterium]
MGHLELELKGVVPAPDRVRASLRAAGARLTFRGMLSDRRYDRDGAFTARDEVVRLRAYRNDAGEARAQLGWKGPTRRSPEGYKAREEREIDLAQGDGDAFLRALGFDAVHAIDRYVEVYELGEAHARLEWYPRMDVLMEVEGTPAAIEGILATSGLPRDTFTSEALTAFTARYDARHPDRPSLVSQDGWQGPSR